MLTYSKIDSYIIPVTASFIGLPVTINGIGTLVLSVCDVNKGKINQHVWQDLGIHINIHRSESIKNVGNPGTIFVTGSFKPSGLFPPALQK
ncbi:hypothetical protein G897_04466 [Escherichia coli KOEGE 131 (358a)]|nr:hypothetical protein G897_04466 [Escherichia coli KOEGE 131 (358a)]